MLENDTALACYIFDSHGPIFIVNGMFTNNQWRWKCVISAFVISQLIKDVTANGHDKLNKLMIAQTQQLFSAKK